MFYCFVLRATDFAAGLNTGLDSRFKLGYKILVRRCFTSTSTIPMIHHTTLSEMSKQICPFLDVFVSAIGKDWGENTPIPFDKIVETCEISIAIWALRANLHQDADKEARLFACDVAERSLSIFEKQYPKDNFPRKAIEISRLFAEGKATEVELNKARIRAYESYVIANVATNARTRSSADRFAVKAAEAAYHAASYTGAVAAYDATSVTFAISLRDFNAEREVQKALFLKRFGADLTAAPKHETSIHRP